MASCVRRRGGFRTCRGQSARFVEAKRAFLLLEASRKPETIEKPQFFRHEASFDLQIAIENAHWPSWGALGGLLGGLAPGSRVGGLLGGPGTISRDP